MYTFIINPLTNKKVDIKSKLGIQIIKNYSYNLYGGDKKIKLSKKDSVLIITTINKLVNNLIKKTPIQELMDNGSVSMLDLLKINKFINTIESQLINHIELSRSNLDLKKNITNIISLLEPVKNFIENFESIISTKPPIKYGGLDTKQVIMGFLLLGVIATSVAADPTGVTTTQLVASTNLTLTTAVTSITGSAIPTALSTLATNVVQTLGAAALLNMTYGDGDGEGEGEGEEISFKPVDEKAGADGIVHIFDTYVVKHFKTQDGYNDELDMGKAISHLNINKIKILDNDDTSLTITYERFKSNLVPKGGTTYTSSGCGMTPALPIFGLGINNVNINSLSDDLQELHNNFITHNDIHDGNIAIKNDGTLAFNDFGLSKIITDDDLRYLIQSIKKSKLTNFLKKISRGTNIDILDQIKRLKLRNHIKKNDVGNFEKILENMENVEVGQECDLAQLRGLFRENNIPLNTNFSERLIAKMLTLI